MRSDAYDVVRTFEKRVAEFCGARHAIATDSCTSAIFLACKYSNVGFVTIPARTYISVPAAIIHAGGSVSFEDRPWVGLYKLEPYPIFDCALRFKRGMYSGGFQCLSFQMKKNLPIGKGGAILTDDGEAAAWFLKARSNGRNSAVPFEEDDIDMLGWNMAMLPEQAARGLQLLEASGDGFPDQGFNYPDLRKLSVFKRAA